MSSGSNGSGSAPLRVVLGVFGLVGVAVCAPARAQDGRLPIPFGESDLYPELQIGYLANDNAFLAPEGEIETNALIVAPKLDWVIDRRLLTLTGTYGGEYAAYDEDALDYADHALSLRADAELGARRRTGGGIQYRRGHETLGLERTRSIAEEIGEVVTVDNFALDGRFRYGARDARGNVEVGAFAESVSYTNLDELSSGEDYSRISPYALFSLRVSGDTRLLFETRFSAYAFENDQLDRTDTSLLTGLEFVATGALSGAARIGARTSRFDNPGVSEDEGAAFTFEVDVDYRPVDYVTFKLVGARELDNSAADAAGRQPLETTLQLRYRHDWSSRFRTTAFIGQRLNDRACPGSDIRVSSGGLVAALQVRRWLELGAGVRATERAAENDCANGNESSSALDFTRTLTEVYVRVTR